MLAGTSLDQEAVSYPFTGDDRVDSQMYSYTYTQSVLALVEQYRVRLGLRTWTEQAAEARERMAEWQYAVPRHQRSELRRSGRSTRAMLHALARSQVDGGRIAVVASRNATLWRWTLLDFASRLELQVDVRIASRTAGLRGWVLYEDHADS